MFSLCSHICACLNRSCAINLFDLRMQSPKRRCEISVNFANVNKEAHQVTRRTRCYPKHVFAGCQVQHVSSNRRTCMTLLQRRCDLRDSLDETTCLRLSAAHALLCSLQYFVDLALSTSPLIFRIFTSLKYKINLKMY